VAVQDWRMAELADGGVGFGVGKYNQSAVVILKTIKLTYIK